MLTTLRLTLKAIRAWLAFWAGFSTRKKMDAALYGAKETVEATASAAQERVKSTAAKVRKTVRQMEIPTTIQSTEEDIIMKKSTFAAILAFLACAVGALTAFALYLHKREKELNEYEQLLFDGEWDEEEDDQKEEEYVLGVDETKPETETEAE